MCAALSMSSSAASVMLPIVAEAEPYDTHGPNDGTLNLDSDDTLTTNNGTIGTNYGTISVNNGTVTTNNGTVEENNGTVETNNCSVGDRTGANGTVVNNNSEGSVYGGNVTNNHGTVIDAVSVVNNYSDGCVEYVGESETTTTTQLTNNYSGSIFGNVSVSNWLPEETQSVATVTATTTLEPEEDQAGVFVAQATVQNNATAQSTASVPQSSRDIFQLRVNNAKVDANSANSSGVLNISVGTDTNLALSQLSILAKTVESNSVRINFCVNGIEYILVIPKGADLTKLTGHFISKGKTCEGFMTIAGLIDGADIIMSPAVSNTDSGSVDKLSSTSGDVSSLQHTVDGSVTLTGGSGSDMLYGGTGLDDVYFLQADTNKADTIYTGDGNDKNTVSQTGTAQKSNEAQTATVKNVDGVDVAVDNISGEMTGSVQKIVQKAKEEEPVIYKPEKTKKKNKG